MPCVGSASPSSERQGAGVADGPREVDPILARRQPAGQCANLPLPPSPSLPLSISVCVSLSLCVCVCVQSCAEPMDLVQLYDVRSGFTHHQQLDFFGSIAGTYGWVCPSIPLGVCVGMLVCVSRAGLSFSHDSSTLFTGPWVGCRWARARERVICVCVCGVCSCAGQLVRRAARV